MGLANVGAPSVPQNLPQDQFDLLNWLRNTVVSLQSAIVPPGTPTNVTATPLAGANQIDFTRSGGDGYVLYVNTTPSINMATRVDLGTANTYVDQIGAGAVKRFYAVRAKTGSTNGAISSWVSATSLALGTATTPPTPPPATDQSFTDQSSDSLAVQYPDKGDSSAI